MKNGLQTFFRRSGIPGSGILGNGILASILLAGAACAENQSSDSSAPPQESAHLQDCDFCPELTIVPAGRFSMGRDDGEPARYEGPVRSVRISRPFAIGVHEVTYAQFSKFVEDTGYEPPSSCYVWDGVRYARDENVDWRRPYAPDGSNTPPRPDDPVACVGWDDAKAYVGWLSDVTGRSYRLPSEAEWAYAAHAGGPDAEPKPAYVWGDNDADACKFANVYDQSAENALTPYEPAPCNDGFRGVAPVGSLQPNSFGLHDMIGNVWEWVEDCYVMTYLPEPASEAPQVVYGCDRRVVKGGSWASRITRQRPEFRGRDPVDTASYIFGLRVARDID